MLSLTARPLIEATVPVLLAHGEAITRHFYERMFSHHPELKNLFNMGNQATGDQAQALAGSVYAFATHMDKPAIIGPVLDRIAHKHVSLGITPAQYTIVGRHLLASLGEVLGAAITPDIAAAWDEVYWLMATELVAREARLYQARDWQAGQDWPEMAVIYREEAADGIVALRLRPTDGSPLAGYAPGQYISVALPIPASGLIQVRQYSLSDAPGGDTWRITVKRVPHGEGAPPGAVSGQLNDVIRVGDTLRVGPPAGDFQLAGGDRAVVLLSAGVGITPMLAMLRHLAATQPARPVVFGYATTDHLHFPHRAEVRDALGALKHARQHLWLETQHDTESEALDGRMDLDRVDALPDDADVYLCGPLPFMQLQRRALVARGIPRERIHYEVFGPDLFGELE